VGQLAVDDETQARDCQWSPAGECQLADVEQTAEQAQDHFAGDAELVSAGSVVSERLRSRLTFGREMCCMASGGRRVGVERPFPEVNTAAATMPFTSRSSRHR